MKNKKKVATLMAGAMLAGAMTGQVVYAESDLLTDYASYAGKRAKILQFGCANTDAKATISPYEFYDNDWEYLGTRTAVYTFGQSIDMIASGRISVKEVISECVSLETLEAYLENGKPAGTLKIIVHP